MKGYYKLDEKIAKRLSEITLTDYSKELEEHDIANIIEDLIYEYDNLLEQFEDYKDNCNENHICKKINEYEEYGISEKDFH